MNLVAVDDEIPSLFLTKKAIQEALPDSSLAGFTTAKEAIDYAKTTRIDIAFLDIELGCMNGLELAKHLMKIYDKTNIIFITGYSNYAIDAFSIGSSGYIMKPVKPETIALEVSRLRNTPDTAKAIKNIGDFTFVHESRRVLHNGKDVLLRPREYNMFLVLASNPGVYFSPRGLYEKTSGQDTNDDIRAIYVHMHRLRKKLGLDDAGTQQTIEIEQSRGKGYRLTVIK